MTMQAERARPAGTPTRRTRHGMRTRAALLAGRLASTASRLTGRGRGAMIGGRIARRVDPTVLRRLAADRDVVLVTGTNGKTTTTLMISEALRAISPVASNSTGANMPDGHVAALMTAPPGRFAALEVDELHLGQVAAQVNPKVLVLLNLSRDQMDRVGEIRHVETHLREVVENHPDAVVVANADDPYIVSAASGAKQVRWVAGGSRWKDDALSCPRCGRYLEVSAAGWACECGLAKPTAGWSVRDDDLLLPDGTTFTLDLRLPGAVNRSNAAVAVAATSALGADVHTSLDRISRIDSADGRYQRATIGGRTTRLLLAKNPASWAEMLDMVGAEVDRPLVLAVNSQEPDGFDVSWLWDVPFEQIQGRVVVATGERAEDVSLRLRYAGVQYVVDSDPVAAVRSAPPGDVEILANYSAFRDYLRRSQQ